MIIWRNGELVEATAAISVDNRGWLIGEAFFETILVENGAAAFLKEHLARLKRGAAAFGIPIPAAAGEIATAIAKVAMRNEVVGRGVCRITLSRESRARGLLASENSAPKLIVSVEAAGPVKAGMRLTISSRRKWTGASTAAFKFAGNYAENILARREAAALSADEAIMLNEHGRVATASAANLFLVDDGRIRTPLLCEGAMPGVIRRVLIEEASRLGVDAIESEIHPAELLRSTLLLTNSVAGVVRGALDEIPAAADDIASQLISAYESRLRAEFLRERMNEVL